MKPQVALIVETSTIYGREVLMGVMRFLRTREDWSVFLEQRDLQASLPSWLNQWQGDGVISRASTAELIESTTRLNIPLVELTDRFGDAATSHVRSDDDLIAKLAADHLIERGFRNFAFCGYVGEAWSKRREQAFGGEVTAQGFTCQTFNSDWFDSDRTWEQRQHDLMAWLMRLPNPCGILACNDMRGHQVMQAAAEAGLAVPEDIAVVGVDNDELLCQFCQPPLTSVIPNAEEVGFAAADRLSMQMKSRRDPANQGAATRAAAPETDLPQVLVPPTGIATRGSTDMVAIDHPEVAAALAYIRQHACEGLTVDQVLEHVGVSRSTLERQVRRFLGRTPQQEIRHVQIKRVRELLATTNLAAEQIAYRAGFDHPEYMHYVFKRELGITPRQYRLSVRDGA